MKFSSTLKELREQNHITQNQLASHLKLTRSTIAGYETKGKQPDYERLLQIADFFHVSVDYTRSTIAGYETKGKQPDYERLLQIADFFHVSVDYLLTGSQTKGISVPPDSSEYRLLCAYLNLSSEARQQLFEYTEFLQNKEGKKGRTQK